MQNATPETILQFHDQLSNELPSIKGKWGFNFKIFRNNHFSVPPELAETHTSSPENMFLHTLSPSYMPNTTITLINRKTSGVFCLSVQEEIGADAKYAIPDKHLNLGATTGLNDSFDAFVHQKLQAAWSQKQIIRGDGGQVYDLQNGNLVFRTSNVFLHGTFKGLLIQIEVVDTGMSPTKLAESDEIKSLFDTIVQKYRIPEGTMCFDVLNSKNLDSCGDLALQYSKIFNF